MRIREALLGVDRLFLDTAPVIYLVEQNPQFFDEVRAVLKLLIEHRFVLLPLQSHWQNVWLARIEPIKCKLQPTLPST